MSEFPPPQPGVFHNYMDWEDREAYDRQEKRVEELRTIFAEALDQLLSEDWEEEDAKWFLFYNFEWYRRRAMEKKFGRENYRAMLAKARAIVDARMEKRKQNRRTEK